MKPTPAFNRREALRRSGALIAGAAAAPWLARFSRAEAQESPYGPFRMSIQSYSLRGYNLDDALAHTRHLGLHYWESFSSHIPLTTDAAKVAGIQGKLKAAGVRLLAYGVVGFGADEAANRNVFEGAKALGIRVLSADPSPQSFDSLEKLVDEFRINIAIHTHGPGSRYDKLQQVADAIKGRNERIGACADLGHFLRSREDPVKVIETLGKRVYGVHLKDVKDATRFTILGKGDLDLVGVLRALRALNYRNLLSLEYEENPKDPIADIEECLAAVRAAVREV